MSEEVSQEEVRKRTSYSVKAAGPRIQEGNLAQLVWLNSERLQNASALLRDGDTAANCLALVQKSPCYSLLPLILFFSVFSAAVLFPLLKFRGTGPN